MKLVVCAKSRNGSFIGLPSAAGYTVFTSAYVDAIHPGDLLANPTWDDEGGTEIKVTNLTKEEKVKITLQKWSLSLNEAREVVGDEELTWHPPWPGNA